MKLLIVAMANSIHTARWLSHIVDEDWEIHLFPVDFFTEVHPQIYAMGYKIKIHSPWLLTKIIKKYKHGKKQSLPDQTDIYNLIKGYEQNSLMAKTILRKLYRVDYVKNLCNLINKINPDIIHSMHIQAAGFLTYDAKQRIGAGFPSWIVSNWGSEIDLFRFFPKQKEKISNVLQNCDFYSGECSREIPIVKDMGFKGKIFAIMPNSGGLDFSYIDSIKSNIMPSKRKNIMLKGYSNWSGRALVGLRALERCADILQGFKITIYCVDSYDIEVAARYFTIKTGIETEIYKLGLDHSEILKLHSRARISIGLSITDAISTSVLESMLMGSFPIQSNTSCADKWFINNETGIMVPPEDPGEVELAIRTALSDDKMVDKAAEKNYSIMFERLQKDEVKEKMIESYKRVLDSRGAEK